MQSLHLALDDTSVKVEVIETKEIRSKHTGKGLRALRVNFETYGEIQNDKIMELFGLHRPFMVTDEGGREIGSFRVRNGSHSCRPGSYIARHWWELEEIENLNITSLVLGDLVVVPYRYSEEVSEGILTIRAGVQLTEDEERRLRALPKYFKVVRKGINDEPREMRFGQLIWSGQERDELKLRLILVDRAYDAVFGQLRLFNPWVASIKALLVETNESINSLVSLLEEKGVISASERRQLSSFPEDTLLRGTKEFDRVPDVDLEGDG